MYYDPATGKVAKKKSIRAKRALPKKDNSIMLELNIPSTTSSKHYKSLFQVEVFRKEIVRVDTRSSERALQSISPSYSPYDKYSYSVHREGSQFKIKMEFQESFQDRPLGSIGLNLLKYQ